MNDASEGAGTLPNAERLRYADTHWAREEDRTKALEDYLRLGDRTYNRTKLRLFMSLAGDVRGKTILDYGGGAGILSIPLAKAGAMVVLVDAETNALKTAEFYASREGVSDRLQTVQATTVPAWIKARKFDVVIAKDIVEHIPEDELFLRDLAECQAPGGMFLLSTQNSQSLNYLIEGSYEKYWLGNVGWLGWDATHVRFYTPRSLGKTFERVGYRPDRWAGVFLIPYDILSWFSLGKLRIELPMLHHLDLTLGRLFPFNRCGWNVIVRARRL